MNCARPDCVWVEATLLHEWHPNELFAWKCRSAGASCNCCMAVVSADSTPVGCERRLRRYPVAIGRSCEVCTTSIGRLSILTSSSLGCQQRSKIFLGSFHCCKGQHLMIPRLGEMHLFIQNQDDEPSTWTTRPATRVSRSKAMGVAAVGRRTEHRNPWSPGPHVGGNKLLVVCAAPGSFLRLHPAC